MHTKTNAAHFRNRWQSEYISRFQSRTKQGQDQENLEIDQSLLIMAEQFPCRLPEKNDKVRRVTLKVSGGTIQRPIVKLEENDSDVEEELHDVDDGSDSVELITFAKKRGPRKSSKGTRRVQHNWTDEEINRLIVAVENHPTLWDVGSSDYKLPKLNVWQEVTDELEMGIDTAEAKSKWSCLRTTFKTILSKIRKSSDGAKLQPVVWKWFTHMLFLEANVRQSTTLDLVFFFQFLIYFIAIDFNKKFIRCRHPLYPINFFWTICRCLCNQSQMVINQNVDVCQKNLNHQQRHQYRLASIQIRMLWLPCHRQTETPHSAITFYPNCVHFQMTELFPCDGF